FSLFCHLTSKRPLLQQSDLSFSVPLKSIDAQLEVKDHVATVVSTLNFENKEDKPVETVFVFPLPGDAAVCHFSAQIGETHIVAEVMDRRQAQQVYDDAVSSGQKVFELEESEQSPDIFSLTVGNLPPGESASIRLEYVTELAVQADDGLRFCLPVVLNPRYQPQGPSVQVTSVPASLVPYSLSFSARISSPRPISKIESSCSLEPLQYLNADQTQATVKLATGHKIDRDVELLIYYKDAHQPCAVVEAGQASAKPGTLMGDPAVMVSLYPEFPESVMSNFTSCGEFVFLLDRSGSMDFPTYCGSRQSRIASAKDTLMLLLKSLPMGCYFNIYGFGDDYEEVFPKSAKYNQKNLKRAVKKVEEMGADLGGSEILEPLRHIYRQPCIPKHPRQLFVFTDGEVNYTKVVLDEVKEYSGFHRCFSFGIGEGASSELINGMAREGGGHAQFIVGKERMQPKVMQSLRFALQPLVTDISLSWDLPEGVSATTLSLPLTALFQGQRSLIFAQLTGECSEAADGCLTVRFTTAGHPCQSQLHFSLQPACDLDFDQKEDMLAARTLIRSVEQEQREHEKPEEIEKVVDLSVQSGVSSIFTAFIAVNKSNGEPVQGPLIYRENPTYSEWLHGAQSEMRLFFNYYTCVEHIIVVRDPFAEPARDPLLELVSLQDAAGCWLLDPCLAAALGKSIEELVKTRPSSVGWLWGTILALIWLHGHQKDVKVEWELLAMKAASWLRAEKAVCVTVCVEAGNVLLGCNVTTDALGL
uniref:von Willebrand factor A domain-containing protein 5A-like n=1 Tax=Poecilia reticulata TaxID=8081 RepID=A0A3P9NI16_POERE